MVNKETFNNFFKNISDEDTKSAINSVMDSLDADDLMILKTYLSSDFKEVDTANILKQSYDWNINTTKAKLQEIKSYIKQKYLQQTGIKVSKYLLNITQRRSFFRFLEKYNNAVQSGDLFCLQNYVHKSIDLKKEKMYTFIISRIIDYNFTLIEPNIYRICLTYAESDIDEYKHLFCRLYLMPNGNIKIIKMPAPPSKTISIEKNVSKNRMSAVLNANKNLKEVTSLKHYVGLFHKNKKFNELYREKLCL